MHQKRKKKLVNSVAAGLVIIVGSVSFFFFFIPVNNFSRFVQCTVDLPPRGQRTYVDYPDPVVAIINMGREVDPTLIKIEEIIGKGIMEENNFCFFLRVSCISCKYSKSLVDSSSRSGAVIKHCWSKENNG